MTKISKFIPIGAVMTAAGPMLVPLNPGAGIVTTIVGGSVLAFGASRTELEKMKKSRLKKVM